MNSSGLKHKASATILIASSSLDEDNWKPVAQKLSQRGYPVVIYEADKVADCRVSLQIQINQKTGLGIKYNGHTFDVNKIVAAWCRRPSIFALEQKDKALQDSVDAERKVIQYFIWDSIPKRAWLNSPQRITHAEYKLNQLMVARAVGFNIPDTLVTNKWEGVNQLLPSKIILKPSFNGYFYGINQLRVSATRPLDNNSAQLPASTNPYPGLWQPYLTKHREWRITVVGDHFFDAAIYTAKDAKDDWRIHQFTKGKVRFVHETFPAKQKKMCLRYLKKMNLKFGAFDFIEGADGKITFLECNANGQYGWLEDELSFDISGAIARELATIADAAR